MVPFLRLKNWESSWRLRFGFLAMDKKWTFIFIWGNNVKRWKKSIMHKFQIINDELKWWIDLEGRKYVRQWSWHGRILFRAWKQINKVVHRKRRFNNGEFQKLLVRNWSRVIFTSPCCSLSSISWNCCYSQIKS